MIEMVDAGSGRESLYFGFVLVYTVKATHLTHYVLLGGTAALPGHIGVD